MARIHPQTVRRFVGLPAWPFAYPIIITSDTSGEARAVRFTARTRIFRSLDNQETENLGSFSDYSRETPVTGAADPADPSQFQHACGRPLGDLTWLSLRLGTSGKYGCQRWQGQGAKGGVFLLAPCACCPVLPCCP